jgi:hypothetical protein
MDTNIPEICNVLLDYKFEVKIPLTKFTIDIDKNKLNGIKGCIDNQTNSIDLQYPEVETNVGYKVIYSLIEIDVVPILSVFIPYEALGIFEEIIHAINVPKIYTDYVFKHDSDVFKCFKQMLYSTEKNIKRFTHYETENDVKTEYITDDYVLAFIFTGNTRFTDDSDEIHKQYSVFIKLVSKQYESVTKSNESIPKSNESIPKSNDTDTRTVRRSLRIPTTAKYKYSKGGKTKKVKKMKKSKKGKRIIKSKKNKK